MNQKISFLFVLVTGAFIFCNCSFKEINGWQEYGLHERVEWIKEVSYEANAAGQNGIHKGNRKRMIPESDFLINFDEKGRILEKLEFRVEDIEPMIKNYSDKLDTTDFIWKKYIYEYNNGGKKLKEIIYHPSTLGTFVLNEENIYNYNPKGDLTGIDSYNTNMYGGLELTKIIAITRDTKQNRVEEYWTDTFGSILQIKIYIYEGLSDRISEISIKDGYDPDFMMRVTYHYEEREDPTQLVYSYLLINESDSHHRYSDFDDMDVVFKYEYKYDEKGNWIQKIVFREDKPEYIIERIIQYYE